MAWAVDELRKKSTSGQHRPSVERPVTNRRRTECTCPAAETSRSLPRRRSRDTLDRSRPLRFSLLRTELYLAPAHKPLERFTRGIGQHRVNLGNFRTFASTRVGESESRLDRVTRRDLQSRVAECGVGESET